MIDSCEITVSTDEIVKVSTGIKGHVSRDTVYTASPASEFKFVGRDLVFKVAAAIGDLAAASAISLKELTITISKNTDYDWVLGTLEPEDILNKQFTIQCALTLNYEDRTWRDYMLEGTTRAVGIQLFQTRDTVGDQNAEFYLEIPLVDFSEWESDRSNDDIVTQTLNFTALYDIANSRLISDCYVVNTTTSY